MKGKLISVGICVITVASLGVVYALKNKDTSEHGRDYHIISPQGDVDYKSDIVFDNQITAGEIANMIAPGWESIYEKKHNKWFKVDPSHRIYYDASIKIER